MNLFKGMWEKVLEWFVNFSNWLEARSQQSFSSMRSTRSEVQDKVRAQATINVQCSKLLINLMDFHQEETLKF